MRFEVLARNILFDYLPKFAEISPTGATFDEFLLVKQHDSKDFGKVMPLCIVPTRGESEGFEYGKEAMKVTREFLENKRPDGRIGFVLDANGLDFPQYKYSTLNRL